MTYELTLAYCANPECGTPITMHNWPMGGTVHGYLFCPECRRLVRRNAMLARRWVRMQAVAS